MPTPKLEDVARHAGVSKTTVSRVLNNRGYLSQKTIDNVNLAISELGYHPNIVARQLLKTKTNLIGILLPTISDPFFGELASLLEKKLYKKGYKVIIGNSTNDASKEIDYLNQLLSKQVDGLIVGTHNQNIAEYRQQNLPIVAIDRIINDDIPIIESDNYKGGVLATERLIDQGAKNIVHTNVSQKESPMQKRRLGYESVMEANNLDGKTYIIDFDIPITKKLDLLDQIFEENPNIDAIFAGNDTDAAFAMQVAQTRGLSIPNDLLIIGYDGTELIRNVLPQLTTIIQPLDNMTDLAVDILEARMSGKQTKKEYIHPITIWEGTTDKPDYNLN
ncbi:LacI family transcriptional regulator [Weissella oryzae SG25]|uniref:LacI family transcriptional regulator n=1 Tax=Weissella oryzae (strain DSM 25784 / JCM 18191 / LMG 30913 / SG25) TaxID=1329250 RepID=A0A069CSB4_WEIOS|nr:LacI family DNA-binding transcriptional regulator [Weissella oryzae]GAK30153.1 LacI family transcriptional regulator [Weissella oryzae SG25]